MGASWPRRCRGAAQQVLDIVHEQLLRGAAEHADAAGVAEHQQAHGVREQRRHLGQRLLGAETQPPQCSFLQPHRVAQAAVQPLVPLRRQAARLHAMEEVEAQIEVARVLAVEVKEGQGSQAQLVMGSVRCRRRQLGVGHSGTQPRQRLGQQRRIDIFLAREVAVDGARGVTRAARDLAQAGTLQAQFDEGLARRGQHGLAPRVGPGALESLAAFATFAAFVSGCCPCQRDAGTRLAHARILWLLIRLDSV